MSRSRILLNRTLFVIGVFGLPLLVAYATLKVRPAWLPLLIIVVISLSSNAWFLRNDLRKYKSLISGPRADGFSMRRFRYCVAAMPIPVAVYGSLAAYKMRQRTGEVETMIILMSIYLFLLAALFLAWALNTPADEPSPWQRSSRKTLSA